MTGQPPGSHQRDAEQNTPWGTGRTSRESGADAVFLAAAVVRCALASFSL